jgi:hypothetical protein
MSQIKVDQITDEAGTGAPEFPNGVKVDQITDEAGTGAPDFPNGLTGIIPAASITDALNASGNAPMYVCRAWVYFNGSGTVGIIGSGNVSSVTDNGIGSYTVNFTTAMPDENYVMTGACAFAGANSANSPVLVNNNTAAGNQTVSLIRVATRKSETGSAIDADKVFIAFFR